jgi:hypothetical protein
MPEANVTCAELRASGAIFLRSDVSMDLMWDRL